MYANRAYRLERGEKESRRREGRRRVRREGRREGRRETGYGELTS